MNLVNKSTCCRATLRRGELIVALGTEARTQEVSDAQQCASMG